MHVIRNGYLSFGKLVVPVGVCTAAKRQDRELKTLHTECLLPVRAPKVCPHCLKDNLQPEEMVKGFEFSKGNYVLVSSEIWSQLTPERSDVIRISKCVSWSDVNELQVERSYYLKPGHQVALDPYRLLWNALGVKEAVGFGKATIWSKEYPVMVWGLPTGTLALSILFCHDEVVPDKEIEDMFRGLDEIPKAQELANLWVSAMMADLDPQKDLFTEQRTRTDSYLASLVDAREFEIPAAVEAPVITRSDVVELFEESLAEARKP